MPYSNTQKQQHITELQRYLHAIDMNEGRAPGVIPDGIYGSHTSAAVRDFQRSHGLPVTGDTDSGTWDEVVREYRNVSDNKPQPYHAFPSDKYVCKKGCSGTLVYVIQAMLLDLGQSYDNLKKVDVCGNYTPATAEAVEEFQEKCGLPCTGNVDCRTWNMLVKCCDRRM